MLHTNSRGEEGIFYKVPGRMGVYTLKVSGIPHSFHYCALLGQTLNQLSGRLFKIIHFGDCICLLYITERILVSIIITKESKVNAKNIVEYVVKDI